MTDPRNGRRDKLLLDTAVLLAQRDGWAAVTRRAVAELASVAAATVSNYRRTRMSRTADDRPASGMTLLGEDVMRWAVDHGALSIVRDGLAARHPIALAADEQLRIAALTS